jgi:hypothetical protein
VTTAPPHPAKATATDWHLAGALVSLKASVDRQWPKRDKASDGGIGDAAHQKRGSASDHNPWLNNTVRAYDFDADGINAAWLAEQLRLAGQRGDRRLAGGPTTDDNGYVIYNGHITAPDFSRWVPYGGSNPHTKMVHVSVTRDPGGYEDAGPWGFLAAAPLHPPAEASRPAPATNGRGPHPGNTAAEAPYPDDDPVVDEPGFPDPGQDAHGTGAGFRAQIGNVGAGVRRLQEGLNTFAPRYSHLAVDGDYGPETAAVVEDFARRVADGDPGCPDGDREGLRAADGNTVGPRIARAFQRVGIRV